MSQHFKSKYDQMRENSQSTDPESQIPESSNNGPVRNICFVMEDGSMTFLNYGYLISGRIDEAKKELSLLFTSHKIEIEGYNLQALFENIKKNIVQSIQVTLNRYEIFTEKAEVVVTKILIKENTT